MRRILGVAALAAGGVALWRMWPRGTEQTGGTAEVEWPLGMGSRANRARHRLISIIGGKGTDTLEDLEGQGVEADTGTVRFDWAFGATESEQVTTAMGMESIPVGETHPASSDRDMLLVDKLRSAGIHLDEEMRDEFNPVPRVYVVGETSPRRLARAVERTLDTRHVGVIVDTSRGIVEIDEHRDVGRGNVLLIDAAGQSRLLRHGTMRSLVAALATAANGSDEPTFTGRLGDEAGAPAPAGAPPDLTQLPPTVDEFVREVQGASSVSADLAQRLAGHLGVQRHCQRCNAPILDAGPVAEALARHYGAPHRREEIAAALAVSPVETGHPQAREYCHQHGAGTLSDAG